MNYINIQFIILNILIDGLDPISSNGICKIAFVSINKSRSLIHLFIMQTHYDFVMLRTILLISFLTLGLMFNGLGMLSLSAQKAYSSERIKLQPEQGSNNSSKVIILAFDDSPKSQFTLAKPILDNMA